MAISIGEIKQILNQSSFTDLPEVMKQYEADERAGVKNELKKAILYLLMTLYIQDI